MRSLCVKYVFVWESLWFWEMVKHFHFAGNWIIFYKLIRVREQAYGFLWMQKRGQLRIKQMFVCTLRHDARCFLSIFRSINLSLIVFVYKFEEWTEFRTNSTNEWIFLKQWPFFNDELFFKDDLRIRECGALWGDSKKSLWKRLRKNNYRGKFSWSAQFTDINSSKVLKM